MERIFVFANEAGSVAELTSGAKASGASVALVTSGKTYGCADEVFAYPEEVSLVSVLSAVSELIVSQKPQLLLCESGSDGRLLAGYTAAKLGVSPLCDVMSLSCTADAVETTRLVYGGSAVKTEQCAFPAVAIVCAGTFEASDAAAEPQVTQINCSGSCSVELAGTSAVEASTVNLAAAKRVVGVGRGLASADNIPAAEKLAAALGAEIGCTRPVAEEEHWYSKDRYIGVSGVMIKPNFYLAIGISGQIQHMVGVNQTNVICAINKDENAPIIKQADYTLIGDVNAVLPAIIEKLG
ncbi:MAG: electron transfer flavoprotein subunit alpha/FixB family protein [Candidatus Limivicinus sp.]|nr:electron transfer flavoprotein subunit alpha/FixB family protein [Candidatus Limivicinus sp.]